MPPKNTSYKKFVPKITELSRREREEEREQLQFKIDLINI